MSAATPIAETGAMERNWLTAEEAPPLVRILDRQGRFILPSATRKLRLFCAACVRAKWDRLTDGRIRLACQTGELLAAGQATQEDAERAVASAMTIECIGGKVESAAGMLAVMACSMRISSCSQNWLGAVLWADRLGVLAADQAAMLRCLWPNPTRDETASPVPLLRTSQGCYALSVAMDFSRSRRFGELGIVATQLEVAGVGPGELLRHLQGLQRCAACLGGGRVDETELPCTQCAGSRWLALQNVHVGGCWALDTLLGY